MLKNEIPLNHPRAWHGAVPRPLPYAFRFSHLSRFGLYVCLAVCFCRCEQEAELWDIHTLFADRRFSLLKFKGMLAEKEPGAFRKAVVTDSFVKEKVQNTPPPALSPHQPPPPPPPPPPPSHRHHHHSLLLRRVSTRFSRSCGQCRRLDPGKKTQLGGRQWSREQEGLSPPDPPGGWGGGGGGPSQARPDCQGPSRPGSGQRSKQCLRPSTPGPLDISGRAIPS